MLQFQKTKRTRIFGPKIAGWLLAAMLCFSFGANAYAAEADFAQDAADVFKSEEGRTLVVPVGEVYGMRLSADGIIVSGFSDVYSSGSPLCPGKTAGLLPGDFLLEAAGTTLESCGQFTALLAENGTEPMEILYRRGDRTCLTTLQPVRSDTDGLFKAGIWIKDSVSGIGTVTFIDPETGVFGSLGHGICENDTGELLVCDSGELLQVKLGSIVKSTAGAPGELTGSLSDCVLGEIYANTPLGVYGTFHGSTGLSNAVEAARRDEVNIGPAEVIADPNGDGAERYTAEIESINPQSDADCRNFIIRVTDDRLLELTGGIVQGMSGSPIIQNGKLVGAVTHVLVNDPTAGYGIFIENMLEAAG